ncbi:MAG: hypothetical protein HKN47_23530 [Pirellulaceae bacterium]|nr:hypothetical protein [Pirellulaceae bacterium]
MSSGSEIESSRLQLSLRDLLMLVAMVALAIGYWSTYRRLQRSEAELAQLRLSTGYLAPSEAAQIAAVRAPSEQPLTYRVRVRVPDQPRYRVAYSSLWEKDAANPEWFAAVDLPPGESLVTVRVAKDPRDERWKIVAAVQSERGTRRFSTVLPDEHASVFRESHDAISTGVGRQTVAVAKNQSLRLLDERWLVGEGSLLLYGDRAPRRDQIGIYAELQPDIGPL